jgi:hypothetical protein
MRAELKALLEALHERSVRMRAGSSKQEIAECERQLGASLPSWLSELYLERDGIPAAFAADSSAKTPQFEKMYVLPVARATASSAGLSDLGAFTLAEEESDVVAQLLDGALQGYIIKIPHDGEIEPLFRNEREYLQELSASLARGRTTLRDLLPSCGGNRSNDDDHTRASALVTSEAPRPSSERRSFQLQVATCLLGSHQSEAFLTVLDDEDLYVRESAEDSLRRLADSPARQLLSMYTTSCKQFELRCKHLVESSGSQLVETTQRAATATWGVIGVRGRTGRLHWLSLAVFYGRRTDPSFDAWFCDRVRQLR